MTKLELISYEESRLAFFEQQLAGANGKLDWAIKHNKSPWDCAEKGEIVSFYQDIVEMLREQAEREKGCEYCRGNVKELVDGDTTIFINHEDKVFYADWSGNDYLDWKHCPMCGRRLEADHDL